MRAAESGTAAVAALQSNEESGAGGGVGGGGGGGGEDEDAPKRYKKGAMLGEGTFGVVYKALDTQARIFFLFLSATAAPRGTNLRDRGRGEATETHPAPPHPISRPSRRAARWR